MRLSFALPFILSLVLASSVFAAQKHSAKAPAKAPDKPIEQIYLETEVDLDEVYQFARDKDGLPLSGTIQSFYPSGRLAWATQWVNGKLHGITRGYYENRKIKEETTWVDGKLHGPARWYDENGKLLGETLYEDGTDQAAPDNAQEKEASSIRDDADNTSADQETPPKEAEGSKDKDAEKK
ncbi:MAG: hypothetical protein LBI88_03270 [Deltaproteobacteria bacterium]|jgi:hypothetical protein|nr:hypothetical protein [Deltaproteobacteria bacterium]